MKIPRKYRKTRKITNLINQIEEKGIEIENISREYSEKRLFPRRKKILDIIRDHGIISLDSIRQRFLKVPVRTLRFDIKKLEEGGFILKVGTTRGAMYRVKVNS